MHILIAPDSFKESINASDAAHAIALGISKVIPHATFDLCPIADGGEGTMPAITSALKGRIITHTVTGPLATPVSASMGLVNNDQVAVIEMAQAAGLPLVPPHQRNPLNTTTFGVGQLVKHALDLYVKKIILAIGGSATNDAGFGLAQALGLQFNPHVTHFTGQHLNILQTISFNNLDPRINTTEFLVACDVNNPLAGPNGAAHIYAPQKGASPQQVQTLDAGLIHLVEILKQSHPQATQLAQYPGAGAAGGLGFGLMIFCNAKLSSGIDLILDLINFNQRIKSADLVITGEGRLDNQSLQGKACLGVAKRAALQRIPTIALVGSTSNDTSNLSDYGIESCHTIIDIATSLDDAIQNASHYLTTLAANAIANR